MAKLLFVRIAGALGMTAVALLFVGLLPFLSADPTAGAGLTVGTPAVSVNRAFKGNRLPLSAQINSAVRRGSVLQLTRQAPEEIPDGCDAAFSPIASPRLAHVYGRCTT
jgi:hypothetical protein